MAIKILSSENITGNITLHSPTNAPYIDFVENADTSDSKAKITMDQVDTNNGTLLFATENAGTLYNQVKITQTGNLLLSDDAASFNTSNAKLNVLPASSGVYQQWNYSPSNENFSLKLKETVTSGNVRYVFEQINNSTTYPNILVFNSGKVGIGTDSPDSKLDVKGASATPADGNQTLSITNTTGGTQLNLGSAENSYGWIEAREGATLRNLLLNPNGGNIGIGTTTPIAPLHVVTPAVGGIDLTNISRTANNLVRFTNPEYSTSATMGLLLRVFPDSDARQGAGLLMTGGSDNAASNLTLFVSKDDGTSSNVSQSYSALHIAGNTGNVGVGTTSPTQKLDTPNIVIGGSSIASNFRANSTMMDNLGGIARFYSLGADTSTAGSYQFNSLSSNATAGPGTVMTILNNGNVGIGVTDPDAKLEIKATGSTTGLTVKTTDASGNENFFIQDGGRTGVRYYPLTVGQASGTSAATGARFQVATTAGDFVVMNDGSVGIGLVDPNTKLEVRGGSGTGEHAHATFTGTANRGLKISTTSVPYGQNNGTVIYDAQDTEGYSEHHWQLGGTTKMVLNKDSNLGINAATPRDKLTVFTAGSSEEEIGLRLVNPIGFTNAGSGASIVFAQDRSQAENLPMAKIRSSQNAGASSCCGDLIFSTSHTGLGGMIDRAQINASGIFQVNPGNTVNGGIVNGFRAAISVAQSAVAISNQAQYGGLAMVWMNYAGNIAYDLVSYSLSKSTVLSSQQISGGPAARVYTSVNGVLKATMTGSDTYSFYVSEIRNAMN